MTRTEHIRQLLKEHNIHVAAWVNNSTNCNGHKYYYAVSCPPGWEPISYFLKGTGRISLSPGSVAIPRPWFSNYSYYVGLHEIGHIVSKHSRLKYLVGERDCEIEAWLWALENAIERASKYTMSRIRFSIPDYSSGSENWEQNYNQLLQHPNQQ